jgi:hypothetical protein
VYKFDASECILHYLNENKELPIGSLSTPHYEVNPPRVSLSKTKEADFNCEKLPSPMEQIYRFKKESEKVMEEQGGKVYTWDVLYDASKKLITVEIL